MRQYRTGRRPGHKVKDNASAILAADGVIVAMAAEGATRGGTTQRWLLDTILDNVSHVYAHVAAVKCVRRVMARVEHGKVHFSTHNYQP